MNNINANPCVNKKPVHIKIEETQISVQGLSEKHWTKELARTAKKECQDTGRFVGYCNLVTHPVEKEEYQWDQWTKREQFWDNMSGKMLKGRKSKSSQKRRNGRSKEAPSIQESPNNPVQRRNRQRTHWNKMGRRQQRR